MPAAGGSGVEPRIVLAGGGTGGHVFPALALAEELLAAEPRCQLLFIGARGGLEARAVPAAGHRLELLESVKARGGPAGAIGTPLRLARALRGALRLLDSFRPAAVVALGGHASVAPGLAARWRGLPLMVLEQNAIPGRASRLLSRFAAEVHAEFAESAALFPRPGKVAATGSPVRRAILEAAERRARRGQPGGKLTLLAAGGSQGARRLNELLAEAAGRLRELADRLRVVHLAGAEHYAAAAEAARRSPLETDVRPFEPDMAGLYERADLAVSRAGATALAELAVCGLPAVLVPFPHAKDNHQEANARCFERAGAAKVFSERGLDGAALAGAIAALAAGGELRAEMAARMRSLGRPEAGRRIAARLLRLAGA